MKGRDVSQEAKLSVESIVSHRTGEGVVNFIFEGKQIQISPGKATEIGVMLIEAAQSAICDAAVIAMAKSIGLEGEFQARMLSAFREARIKAEPPFSPSA